MLGVPLPDTAAQHVDQCPECRRQAAEIRDVVRTLHRAAPKTAAFEALGTGRVPLPPDLGSRVRMGIVQVNQARTRRRHRIAVGAAAAVLAAATAVFVPVLTSEHPSPPTTAVAVAREGRMVAHSWGTEVPVAVTGLQPGQTYRLMTADASGHRLPGGSVRGTAEETVYTRVMTAIPRDAITSLLVEDANGHVVARLSIVPPSSPAPV
jgi:hypothetical protein